MKVEEEYSYPTDIDTVWKMIADRDFALLRAKKLGAADPEVVDNSDPVRIDRVTSGGIPEGMVPPAAERFIPPSTRVEIAEEWTRRSPELIEGTLSVSAAGVPASLSATIHLSSAGAVTNGVLTGDLKVRIPLLGRKIEQDAAPFVSTVTDGEQECAKEWLANHTD